MSDLSNQGISVDNKNEPAPESILCQVTQMVNDLYWKAQGIIFPRQSKNYNAPMQISQIILIRSQRG